MPGFAGHTFANSLVLIATSKFLVNQGWPTHSVVAVDLGIAVATLVLSPDMDLFTSKPMKEWGVLKYFWWPYARLVKHRNGLHTPIVGTAVRWVYLLVVIGLIQLLVGLLLREIGVNVSLSYQGDLDNLLGNLGLVFDLYLGASIADAAHFALDMTTRGLMGRRNRRSKHFL